MSIKLKTSGDLCPVRIDLVSAAEEAAHCVENIHQYLGKIDELDMCMSNMFFALESLKRSDNPEKVMDILDLGTSCESLINLSADKITVNMAVEGIGSAIKEAWEKFKELCKKFWETIKGWFSKSGSQKVASTTQTVNKTIEKVAENKRAASTSASKEIVKKFNPHHKLNKPIKAYATNLDVLPTFTDKMFAMAKASSDKMQKILSEGDANGAAGYGQWLGNQLQNVDATIKWHWHIDNQDGNGDIKIDYSAGVSYRDEGVSTVYEAGVKTENDIQKLKLCCDKVKKFVEGFEKLPDLSNYMKEHYSDPKHIENINDNAPKNIMSFKSAMKLHLRFFGLLGKCVVDWQLKSIDELCHAVDESYE